MSARLHRRLNLRALVAAGGPGTPAGGASSGSTAAEPGSTSIKINMPEIKHPQMDFTMYFNIGALPSYVASSLFLSVKKGIGLTKLQSGPPVVTRSAAISVPPPSHRRLSLLASYRSLAV